ncbi:MAG: helicase-related protein [Gemmatimonadota bacterium]|nr:helicase-related protein [Gemmatimonadota bacterium]
MLSSSARADIAVGYFFMSGFAEVMDDQSRLNKTRILVGRADRPTLEAVAAGLRQADALRAQLDAEQTVSRRQRQEAAAGTVSEIAEGVAAMPQTDATQHAVKRLRQLVAAGLLEVRAYPREFLHAKAYLCWYDNHAEPGAAMVGSSNLSLAGFTGNTELNVRVTGDDEMATLKAWFEDLWFASVDISAQVEQSLAVSWAVKQYTPYAIYLKALYELYGQDLGSDEPLPLEPIRGIELANFQLDAVRRGLDMIRSYGGCYVADVVGLGKTYIGAELLRQLRQSYPNDGPPLIICPAGLVETWRRVGEQYGLGAEVLSQDRIAPPPDLVFDPETEQYEEVAGSAHGVYLADEYRYRGPVLVDEAHNFRNDVNRSRGLRDYLERGDHKVILLSATPQNLGPRDIYRQVRLFLDETDHGLPLEPLALEDYFASVVRWQEYRGDVDAFSVALAEHLKSGGEGDPPIQPQRPDTPPADIAQVLTPIFIRRRRRDIAEIYGDTATINGEPVAFPTPRLSSLEYGLDQVYAKAGDFTELLTTLGRHQAVRYNPTEYLKPGRQRNQRYAGLFRARGRIAGMIRHLLFKRLESSIQAFRTTLVSLSRSNRSFKAALEAGYVPVGSVATNLLAGQNFNAEEALAVLQLEEAKRNGRYHFPAADFDVARWVADLDADHAVLDDLLSRIADIGPQDDDKLARLRTFLKGASDEKVLIFSEAETTVDYLYEQLNPDGQDSAIAKLSGSNRDQRAGIVSRFAPQANLQDNEQLRGEEVQVLIATDVVSEGQNMQDCARVLNYDLHWNPVRLIQRFGRVDRIGSPHDEIHLHNMLPDAKLDETLGLTGKLSDRIQAFHDLIGLDNKVLSEEERLNAQGVGVIYDDRELPELDDALDEVAANQRAIALLQNTRSNDADLWQTITELPDGIRSALTCSNSGNSEEAPQAGETMVMLAASDAVRCYAVGDDLVPRPIRTAQFVAAAECESDTPAQSLPENTNERVNAATEAFSNDLSRVLGTARRRTPGNARNRSFIRRQLNGIGADIATAQRIEALRQAFASDLPTVVENELSDLRRLTLGGRELALRLELLQERYRLNPERRRDVSVAAEATRIVCSDGLL